MTTANQRRRPAPATLVGGILTAGGIFLAVTVDMVLLVVAGLGAFGPGILRELGWLHDQDEFRRRAAWRAGYHAYLAGGFVAVIIIAATRAGTANMDTELSQSAALVLSVLWLVWMFASLFEYWGADRAVRTVLYVMGAFWLVFNILGNLTDPVALAMQCLVAVPFLALGWMAGRWPRVAGVLLLVAGVGAVILFDLHRAVTEQNLSSALVFILFAMPLFAGGLGLLRLSTD